MSTEENKAVIRRVFEEVLNKGDLSLIPELIAPDYVYHSPLVGGEFKGPEGFRQMVTMFRNAFPDLHCTIEDMVAEGDKLAIHVTLRGTFKGKFGDIAPTGKQFNMTSAYFYRMAGGKEVEALPFMDMLTWFQQLGISPPGQ